MTSSNDPTITTLSEIVGVKKDELYKKFNLEPWFCDPHHKENLVFLSPTVLLDDRELREGGFKDRGPKEVFGRLTKDILSEKKSKQWFSFQVPEIPYLHMGYGKTSENKEHNMALTEKEAKVWMDFLDLSRRKKPGEVLRVGETPMEEDVTFPTPERPKDYHAFEFEKGDAEELVDPCNSGLKRRVNEINKHHEEKSKSGEEGKLFQVPTVQKSTMDILERVFTLCKVPPPLEKSLMDKYRKYYGTEQLKRKYNLPTTRARTPIILVPLSYKVEDMPAEIEHLGTKWQEIGDVHLVDEFISKFIENEEIQTDFLNSFGYLKDTFTSDYGVILPDEDTFTDLIDLIEDKHPDILRRVPKQGRNLVSPRVGVVKHTQGNRSVCFSYFKGSQNQDVAASLRVIGSNRLSCITLAILHSASISHSDPRCRLLSLYPVESCRRFSFKGGKLQKRMKFDVGNFCRIEFPGTFNSLEQAIQHDWVVKKTISQSKGQLHPPKYERQTLLQVAYTKHQHPSKLIKAAVAQTQKELKNCTMRAANLDGCLLSRIANTRQNGVGVVLAINDTLTPDADNDLPPLFTAAMKRVIIYFVQAVIIAGLPSVYPPEPDEEDGDEESGSSEDEDDDETSDDEQPNTSGLTSSGESGIVASNSSSETAPTGKGLYLNHPLHT
ncbi:hypothetical protein ACROYT_G004515 [Oculina patagonica]